MTTAMKSDRYTFHIEFDVRDYELDSEGIVNNAVYLHYLEYTRHVFCKEAGYGFAQMQADGLVPVMSHIEASYRSPLRSGDVVLSELWVESRGPRFIFHQRISSRDERRVAVEAVVTIVAIENGRLSRGDTLRQALKHVITVTDDNDE